MGEVAGGSRVCALPSSQDCTLTAQRGRGVESWHADSRVAPPMPDDPHSAIIIYPTDDIASFDATSKEVRFPLPPPSLPNHILRCGLSFWQGHALDCVERRWNQQPQQSAAAAVEPAAAE